MIPAALGGKKIHTDDRHTSRLHNLLKDQGKKRLIENIFSLSFLRGINYLLPLITLPYLTRVLGVEKFGLVMFAQALAQYFIFMTDYGFYLSATREIALNRDKSDKISSIFNSVMITKLCLAVLGLVIVAIMSFTIPKFKNDWLLYLLTYGMVFGYALFPEWFFQGMEKMKYITLLNIIAKTIFTVSIFIFIRTVDDYLYVPVLFSAGFIAAGLLGIIFARRHFGVRFFWPGMENIKTMIRGGFHIFATGFATQLYNNSVIFLLGIFTNNTLVGYFSAANKVLEAVNSLIYILSQAFFPYLNRRMRLFKKFSILMLSSGFIMALILFTQAPTLVSLLFGPQYEESVILLRILAVSPLLIAVVQTFGTNLMLILKHDKIYMTIGVITSLAGVLLSFVFIRLYSHTGAALSLLLTRFMFALIIMIFGIRLLKSESFKIEPSISTT